MSVRRLPGDGWLVLIGGGEFSFGETVDLDRRWLERVPEGVVGFLPTASGSTDYGQHFAAYLEETFGREARTIPIYRPRDARRGKNLERLDEVACVYVGAGVADHLLETLVDSPAAESLGRKLGAGGVVVAIAAAAQACGTVARSLMGGATMPGLGWLPGGVVEPNFDPAHDRRLRQLLAAGGVEWGIGLPAGSALYLGPGGEVEIAGTLFLLEEADGDYQVMRETPEV